MDFYCTRKCYYYATLPCSLASPNKYDLCKYLLCPTIILLVLWLLMSAADTGSCVYQASAKLDLTNVRCQTVTIGPEHTVICAIDIREKLSK